MARRNAQAPHPQEHQQRTAAFAAQRHEINSQPGPSNNRQLNALDKLQNRDFKPAVGGLEIPLTPHSLLGGGKRVYQRGETSRDVRVVPRGVAEDLRQKIDDKRELITRLATDLQDETDPGQMALTTEALRTARVEFAELIARAQVLGNEDRRVNGLPPASSR
jgi:type III effector protein AvrRps4